MRFRRVHVGWWGAVVALWMALVSGPTCSADDPLVRPRGPGREGEKAGDLREDNGLKLSLVWCPPGTFTMGSPKQVPDRGRNEDEVQVTLTKGFWLGKTEVTQEQWKSVVGTEPWKGKSFVKEGGTYPATYVSWEDAVDFCRKLTEQERSADRMGADEAYRLPTEAEWEYACRARTTTAYSFGEDASGFPDRARGGVYAWFDENSRLVGENHAHHVGTKKANPWGLLDMHGNVSEWCGDWYADGLPGGRDPVGASTGSIRVHRGGSWLGSAWDCRSACRGGHKPGSRSGSMGFRVARSSVR